MLDRHSARAGRQARRGLAGGHLPARHHRDRATLALIADAAAAAGFVIVGIDLPLHGIMPNDPLYALSPTNPANAALPAPFRVGEPTFNVDYVNNTTRRRDRTASPIPPASTSSISPAR